MQATVLVMLPSGVLIYGSGRNVTDIGFHRRDMRFREQQAYIRAVKCLQGLPAKDAALDRKYTRFDEFVIAHVTVADVIHGVGQFLPWHRQFGFLYETALRQECAYRGPFPFWDWTRDTNGTRKIGESPLFDAATGFGGDGVPGTYTVPTDNDNSTFSLFIAKGCVADGPFAWPKLTLHVGPGRRRMDHCLTRGIDEAHRTLFTREAVEGILGWETYDGFWNALDGRPYKKDWRLHDGGHLTVGGDMTSFYSSPNDPLFYLHHAGLDRVWWTWQHANPKKRLQEIGGRSSPNPPYGVVTLDYPLEFAGFAPTVPIRDAIDVGYEPYCYAYP
ncbi:hypothetical protein D9611_000744 [Ephemerocybe angulata]|uniref:Tyrosinase copper-binding domain-containing protein n=1 Tax=Ephemerocybe angulata TaxID=980116 RepID=A0A8H5BMN4_9AGAR|nr:hypothetical protein D9611_000744 [Tulosesus angulatus]